jgi:hypothetical protein
VAQDIEGEGLGGCPGATCANSLWRESFPKLEQTAAFGVRVCFEGRRTLTHQNLNDTKHWQDRAAEMRALSGEWEMQETPAPAPSVVRK